LSEIVEKIISLLQDGEPHSVENISKKCGLEKSSTENVINFLRSFDFVEVDETRERIRINQVFLDFLHSVS